MSASYVTPGAEQPLAADDLGDINILVDRFKKYFTSFDVLT